MFGCLGGEGNGRNVSSFTRPPDGVARIAERGRIGSSGVGGWSLTVEGPLIRHVVHEQDPHRSAVVCRRDSPEALLPCRVPYLKLDSFPVELDGPDLEVDADGCDEGRGEGVFAESE